MIHGEADEGTRERYADRASTVDAEFRRRYSLPPLDPRYLDMTEAGMIEDLAQHAALDDRLVRRHEPGVALALEAKEDPAALRSEHEAARQAFLAEHAERLRSLTSTPDKPAPSTVRISGVYRE